MSSFDYLKTAIKQQGCTLQQVADASGMTKGYLSQLLNAKIKSPSAQKLEALHRFLGLEFPRQKKTIGVVFGKFYPLHTGHIYLIQRACSQVDELHIIMGFDDTRDRALFEDSAMSQQPTVPDRLRWLLQTFKYQKNIRIHAFNEEGMEPYPHGWDVWSNGIKKFMAEKGIQPDLILHLGRSRCATVYGTSGDRDGAGRSEAYLYEYQRCADPRKPVPLLGIYSYGSEAVLCAYRGDPWGRVER